MTNNKTQPTTDSTEARTVRIARRRQIIEALFHTYGLPFQLVQLGLDSQESVVVDLDFTAEFFPGRYKGEIVDILEGLERIGLVRLTQIREVTSYQVKVEDEVDKAFIDELFR